MSVFDERGGEIEKRIGMERAEKHVDPVWWQAMLESGRAVALRKPFFNSDDVEAYRRVNYPNTFTHEGRATGPLMMALARAGYCLITDDFIPGRFREHHMGPKRVWYSLLYNGPGKPRLRRRKIHDPRQYHMDLTERLADMEQGEDY